MHRFGLKTVFSKLFASVMLTLILFAAAMIALTHLVHDNSSNTKWQILAQQIVNQIDPFVDELDNSITMQQRLQARFMLAVIKKSFDIFDESLQAKLGLYDREGRLLIQTDDSNLPKILPEDPAWISRMIPSMSGSMPRNVQAMGDRGYVLLYEPRNPPKPSEIYAFLNLFTGTIALLIIMTVVLWWIARSMTWRINRMSQQMMQLGDGDFSVRVPAKGTDEIATLAKGFNQAAQKIEQLIDANSLLLAHASHELRTPITRIRLQIEMMEMLTKDLPVDSRQKFGKRAQAVNRDLTGLNDLVESILLVSRMDAGHAVEKNESLDLFTIVSTECQHYPEATLYGQSVTMLGQPKLLVHLIRNLLNNASIHGKPPIEVHLYGVIEATKAATPPKDLYNFKTPLHDNKNLARTINNDQQPLQTVPVQTKASGSNLNDACASGTLANENLSINSSKNIPTKTDQRKFIKTDDTIHPVLSYTTSTLGNIAKFKTKWGDKKDRAIKDDNQLSERELKDKKSLLATKKHDSINKGSKSGEGVFAKHLRRTKSSEVAAQPNFAVLAVIDQGEGIPLEKRQEIFSPFVRLQQKNKGSGLGLSLVAQIVDAHHGQIFTDTYQGKTRFLVVLPTST